MSYRVLDPSQKDSSLSSTCALAVMAKAPRPGKVKTRLAPPLTLDESAALNICFLKDTAQNLSEVSQVVLAHGLVCYTPVGDEALFDGILPDSFTLIAQRGDGFGERLLAAAQDILACGYGAVCLIDSDSPTVPSAAFEQAVRELARDGERVVLGGSDDGGYYLIGMKTAHPEPFEQINWSTSTVYAETVAAIRAASMELVELPTWYDVDDGATLHVLSNELLRETPPPFAKIAGYPAPHSREFLQRRAKVSA
jgi:rSAM/selenodomain-associated transferase 1